MGRMMPDPTVNDMMEAYAQDAVDFARERFQINLDFSEDSLQQTEQILGKLHELLPQGFFAKLLKRGPSDNQIQQMAKMWGGYVGEVIRRRWNGQWSRESKTQSGAVITLHIGDTEIYPPAKVYKRFTLGSADNIRHYYQVLKSNLDQAKSN